MWQNRKDGQKWVRMDKTEAKLAKTSMKQLIKVKLGKNQQKRVNNWQKGAEMGFKRQQLVKM